ncbi:hypothetical protein WJX84_000216 [Apatococcus fuscideae]|uniref:Uncharacterized protein n=1 Tax=Apatococcus fuscideae TaxID=2026836 RepID=A0AAW1T8B1_9CHLO
MDQAKSKLKTAESIGRREAASFGDQIHNICTKTKGSCADHPDITSRRAADRKSKANASLSIPASHACSKKDAMVSSASPHSAINGGGKLGAIRNMPCISYSPHGAYVAPATMLKDCWPSKFASVH